MEAVTRAYDRRRLLARIEAFMELNVEGLSDWIARTRTAQGLDGTVTMDLGLHARTVAAVDRAHAVVQGEDCASNELVA